MATLSLVRIDHRLIHGQVMTMWSKEYVVDHIMCVDDPLSKDDFMKRIYMMAVPSNIKVKMYSLAEAAKCWQENQFGEGHYLVLFRDPKTALEAWKAGFHFEKLQVGNVPADSSSEMVHKTSRLSKSHLPPLIELAELGVEVYVQPLPAESPVKLKDLVK